jgi:glycosyltransferase involved in cell wall biosynthesis
MLNNPLVSIIIPTYNREYLIAKTLDSILIQTYENWECIVVDDSSTDGTDKLLNEYIRRDKRFTYLTNVRAKGAQGARNTGIVKSKGNWIVFLDSDDVLTSSSISDRLFAYEEHKDLDAILVYGDFTNYTFPKIIGDGKSFLSKNLALCSFSVMMVHKEKVFSKELLDENFPAWQDDDLVMRMSSKGNLLHSGKQIAVFAPSLRLNSITSSKINLSIGFKLILSKYKMDIIKDVGYMHWFFCCLRYTIFNLENRIVERNNLYFKLKKRILLRMKKYVKSKFDVIFVE